MSAPAGRQARPEHREGDRMMVTGYRRVTGRLSRTQDAALLLARVITGWLMLLHGLRKFQGPGGVGSFQHLLTVLPNVPFPGFTGAVLPWLEVVAAALLIAGALTRLAAIVLAVEMAIIAMLIKFGDAHVGVIAPAGAATPGAEVEFLFIAALLVLFLLGPGRASVDGALGLEAPPQAAGMGQPAGQPARLNS